MCSYNILNGGTTTKCSRIPCQTIVMCFYFILDKSLNLIIFQEDKKYAMKLASCEEMPSIRKFFHLKNNDLTTVTWAQNVYNNRFFQGALEENVMMMEGSVTLEQRRHDHKNPIPTMYLSTRKGKKISKALGMTLQQLLEMVVDAKSVGVKLNFNQITVFKESIKVLQAMRKEIKFPLWLNADTDKMEDKDIDKFLSLCTHNFPKATISIGMLHKGQKIGSEKRYNAKLVTQMKDTLIRNNVTQTVAFTVQLLTAAYSQDTLPALKDVQGITDSALYMYMKDLMVYSSDDISNIKKLINIVGKDRMYLNTPYNLLREHLLTSNEGVYS